MMLWHLALVMALVVAVVVTVLLAVILNLGRQIEGVAQDIWTVGQRIAHNTVHIPDLAHTNGHVKTILTAAPALIATFEQIRAHAETCPGCPNCILAQGGTRWSEPGFTPGERGRR